MQESLCPMGLKLASRRVVFAGAGDVAQRKIQRVLKMGAQIEVIAPQVAAEIKQLATVGDVTIHLRTAQATDFDGAFLAFIATDDGQANRELATAARARGALVNQADDPENCDFVLPALAYMNTLRIGIFSDSPALSKWVRRYLERTLGSQFPEFAGVFGQIRRRVRAMELSQAVRAEIINRLLNEGLYDTYREAGEKATIARAEEVVNEYTR